MVRARFFLPVVLFTSCSNPYVVDAPGVQTEETTLHHESYDDASTDDYLEKPMVKEVDADGVTTTPDDDNDDFYLDWPDAYDKSLFESPAMSLYDEQEVDDACVPEGIGDYSLS